MADYAATNHVSKQDMQLFEARMEARFATRAELKQVEKQANETATTAEKIEVRLGGIERSVNEMSANVTRLFWSVIGSVLLAIVAKVVGWL